MMITFRRVNADLVCCNLCDYHCVSNLTEDDTKGHKHISLLPLDITKSKIIWRNNRHAILQVSNNVKEEMQLIYDMCRIARHEASSFLCGDSLQNMTHYIMLLLDKNSPNATIIGYVSYSLESFKIKNKTKQLPTGRQISILPEFRRRGYARFLQLKTVELQHSKMFVVDGPNSGSKAMLYKLVKSSYLELIHKIVFGGAPGFIFKVLKTPTSRMIRA